MSNQLTPGFFKIAIASNFTIKPIHNIINYWADQLSLSLEQIFAPYQQILQSLISSDSEFSKNVYGVNVVFLRLEDCWPSQNLSKESFAILDAFLDDLEKALIIADKRHGVPLIIVQCPSSVDCKQNDHTWVLHEHYCKHLAQMVSNFDGVYYVDEQALFDLYPLENYEDHFAYEQGKIPYTRECFTALGTLVIRKITALLRKPYKVIVLDCDNTLWKGVCAEDGAANLIIDDNYKALQQWMVNMQQQGFLLCLCSKNLEQDVWTVFEHFGANMPLQKQGLVSWRINWQEKFVNIKSLSEELNLSLDSFIFLDDNELECAQVQAVCPEVACFRVPSQSSEIPAWLKHLWVFDRLSVSEVDRERTKLYQQENDRKELSKSTFSLAEFISQLQLQLDFYALNEAQLERVSQMTQRTNQFNLTGEVLSVSSLKQAYLNGEQHCLIVEAKDRYGDYGVIACVFYGFDQQSLRLDNLLISCRALGKQIEDKIWQHLCEIAKQHAMMAIDVKFKRTPRNDAAAIFLTSLGADEFKVDSDIVFRQSLEGA